nr:unnamed protein product [Callosobruchus chinensis]
MASILQLVHLMRNFYSGITLSAWITGEKYTLWYFYLNSSIISTTVQSSKSVSILIVQSSVQEMHTHFI